MVPGKKWNIFVVPHEHLDVGFSDFQGKVAEVQSRVIDEAMAMARRDPDFRFSADGYWSAEQFLADRSESDRQEFVNLVRQGRIPHIRFGPRTIRFDPEAIGQGNGIS